MKPSYIFKKEFWNSYELLMTEEGFQKCGQSLENLDIPQIYVHVGCEGKLEGKVLRIGKAESGAYKRWITNNDGHMHTFLWALGKTTKYTEIRAEKTPLYMLFFGSMLGLKTKLYILSCKDKFEAKEAEKQLTAEFSPIWEKFKKAHKVDPRYPLLSTSKRDPALSKNIAICGNAIKLLQQQREDSASSKYLPDLLDWDTESYGTFDERIFS